MPNATDNPRVQMLYKRRRGEDEVIEFVKFFAEHYDSKGLGPVYYVDKHADIGRDQVDEIGRVFKLVEIVVAILRTDFMIGDWPNFVRNAALKGSKENDKTFIALIMGEPEGVREQIESSLLYSSLEILDVPNSYRNVVNAEAETRRRSEVEQVEDFWSRLDRALAKPGRLGGRNAPDMSPRNATANAAIARDEARDNMRDESRDEADTVDQLTEEIACISFTAQSAPTRTGQH